MKLILLISILFSVTHSNAYNVQVIVHNTMKNILGNTDKERQVANESADEDSYLVYYSPNSKSKSKIYAISPTQWAQFKNQANSRLDLFLKLYYANIKNFSNSGQKHVGCFVGDAERLVEQYFNTNLPIANLDGLLASVSEDRKMIGLEFKYKNFGSNKLMTAHYRLPHCVQGAKAPLIDYAQIKIAKNIWPESKRSVASLIRMPAAAGKEENGFDIYDKLNKMDEAAESAHKLPRFKLRADYDEIQPNAEARPWKGMDISNEQNAQKFAQLVLDYFYDSLAQDANNAENNFNAQGIPATKVQWCHLPWLNVGDSGREMIHGLTKERDLEKSEIYPEVNSTKDKEGSDWGIGFYNDIACTVANRVYGSSKNALASPDFTKSNFPDGSVSVKVLFTTANLDALKDSYSLVANVSLPKSTSKRLRKVKMIQIDVAVKDSTLKGVNRDADGWMMTSFYYDAAYTAPSRHKFTGVLSGLSKMRPIGIQTGFEPANSIIFKGSKTNSENNQYYGNKPMLMNGPADNPKASCLSCHGAAGTAVKMVPGIKDFAHYNKVKRSGLDFSQQLALGKRNHETRSGQKTSKGW